MTATQPIYKLVRAAIAAATIMGLLIMALRAFDVDPGAIFLSGLMAACGVLFLLGRGAG